MLPLPRPTPMRVGSYKEFFESEISFDPIRKMFNIYMALFIVAAIFIIAGGTYKFYSSGQMIAAFFFFIGSLTIFIIYGIRWFSTSNSVFSKAPVAWPPMINTCPDYLTYYKRMKKGKSSDTCVDLVGVSRNGYLKKFPKGSDEGGVEPEDDAYYFDLTTTSTDPLAKGKELCQRAMTFGLTWEGITNGESCVSSDNGGGDSGGGSNPAGGCPAK